MKFIEYFFNHQNVKFYLISVENINRLIFNLQVQLIIFIKLMVSNYYLIKKFVFIAKYFISLFD